MTALTNHGELIAVTAVLAEVTHVSLHTGDPGETGASNELVVENGYIRIAASFTVDGSSGDNDAQVQFGPKTANTEEVTHFCAWDAESTGNSLFKGELTASRNWESGTLSIGPNSLSLTMD